MAGNSPRRILFVGMANSPHAARWIRLVADQGWDLHFFPVSMENPHPLLSGVTLHVPWIKIRPRYVIKRALQRLRDAINHTPPAATTPTLPTRAIYPLPVIPPMDHILGGFKTKRLGESDVQAPLPCGPQVLVRLIKQLKPDLIHSMEFQHAGYTVLRAKELMGNAPFPKWLATNWGSDIYYYKRFPDHYAQISRLLKQIDYYSCECERDIGLAREMGLVAKAMPVLPNTGGFDIEAIRPVRESMATSKRRIIMVKGYQHFAGRALTALDALLRCADSLGDYRIVVFSSTSADVTERVEELRMFHGMNISILPHSSHEKMLRYFAHARVYLGVSISDAISTSMLEAMAMGAFPIQTTTACCEEWTEDGVSGFHIPPDDVDMIANRIRCAVTEDALVDDAARRNWQTVCTRLDQQVLRVKEVDFYNQLFADMQGTSSAAEHAPIVSVIIPTYNRAHYLPEAIASVLTQDFESLELIVVDDGSIDGTAEVMAAMTDPRIHYIAQANKGRSAARNVALQQARGRYIAFLDSDDTYLPHKLSLQVRYLDANPEVGMVYTSARCIDHAGNPLPAEYLATVSGHIYRSITFFRPVTITLPTVMVRGELIMQTGGFDEAMHRFEDTDMWRRLSKLTTIHAMPEFTCVLRTHADNQLASQNRHHIMMALAYYSQKIRREDADIGAFALRRGLASIYYYYGRAFLTVKGWQMDGFALLVRSFIYWPPAPVSELLRKFGS